VWIEAEGLSPDCLRLE